MSESTALTSSNSLCVVYHIVVRPKIVCQTCAAINPSIEQRQTANARATRYIHRPPACALCCRLRSVVAMQVSNKSIKCGAAPGNEYEDATRVTTSCNNSQARAQGKRTDGRLVGLPVWIEMRVSKRGLFGTYLIEN